MDETINECMYEWILYEDLIAIALHMHKRFPLAFMRDRVC